MAWLALALSVASCGSDEPNSQTDGSSDSDGGRLEVEIYPRALYSAYIEGSRQVFQVPAIVAGLSADSWECDDPDAVDLEPGAVPNGVMITTRKAGKFKIRASSGRNVGQVDLEVSEATEEQLSEGLFRYTGQIELDFEGQKNVGTSPSASCSGCHGSRRESLAFDYTPQQIGGYSDDELKAIFWKGMKPPGAAYGTFPNIKEFYPLFHRWAGSDAEYQTLVIYMRSFKPVEHSNLDHSLHRSD